MRPAGRVLRYLSPPVWKIVAPSRPVDAWLATRSSLSLACKPIYRRGLGRWMVCKGLSWRSLIMRWHLSDSVRVVAWDEVSWIQDFVECSDEVVSRVRLPVTWLLTCPRHYFSWSGASFLLYTPRMVLAARCPLSRDRSLCILSEIGDDRRLWEDMKDLID